MRLVKLNRRYKAFKEEGHTWAFRFSGYDPKIVGRVEKIFQDLHGSQYKYWGQANAWKACFGSPRPNGPRPYWISFRDEYDATVVLLRLESST